MPESSEKLWEELQKEFAAIGWGPPNQWLGLERVSTPKGDVYSLSVRDDELMGNLIEVTDDKLLAKLRSIQGQFSYSGLPIFWYEHLMSTADLEAHISTFWDNVRSRSKEPWSPYKSKKH